MSPALLAEQAEFRLLANDAGLDLSEAQSSTLVSLVQYYQAVRQAFEATIATATKTQGGHYRVEIPPYPSAGDALRARFVADVDSALGSDCAAAVIERLGPDLERRFAGFGVCVQTLDIVASDPSRETDLEVTRTATFWDSVDGGERLKTRRETHFPALEDPAGDEWGPMLSVVAEAASASAKI